MITKQEVIDTALDLKYGLAEALEDPAVLAQVKEVLETLPGALITTFTLLKARKLRKQGDWLEAIYYLILWSGLSRNFNSSQVIKELKKKTTSFSYNTNVNSPFNLN